MDIDGFRGGEKRKKRRGEYIRNSGRGFGDDEVGYPAMNRGIFRRGERERKKTSE